MTLLAAQALFSKLSMLSIEKQSWFLILGAIVNFTVRQESKNGEKYKTAVYHHDDFKYHDIKSEQRRTNRLIKSDNL